MRRLLGRVGAAGLASVASSRPAWSNGGQCVAEAEEEEEYALPKLGLRRERRVADVVYDSVIVGCGKARRRGRDVPPGARRARGPGAEARGDGGRRVLRLRGQAARRVGRRGAVPPEGFVDGAADALVRVLGLGESSDAAVEAEALALAARGGEVAVIGGSWQAAAAGRLALAPNREASGHSGSAATLVFPEQTPVGARLPKALGLKLRKRLEKRGVAVVGHSQVRYAGPSASSRRCLLYLGRVDDALKTSQAYADLVVVAGGEHVPPAEVSARALRRWRAGRVRDEAHGPRRPARGEAAHLRQRGARGELDDPRLRRRGRDAVPPRVATRAPPPRPGHRACTIANDAGVHHAEATGAAAGDHLATLDGRGAAAVVARLADGRRGPATLGLHVTLVGKCDATLEAHHFYGKHVNVAVYVEKSASTDDGGPSRAPVGVHPDRLWELDLENLRTLLDECLAASGTDERAFRHAHVISRADRLGPRFYDGLGAADTALFSRGKNSKMADRVSRPYASGVVHGPGDAAPRSFAPRGGATTTPPRRLVALAARRAPSVSSRRGGGRPRSSPRAT
ncbi:hypothetical protein JL720_1214 [Aureococcus anophagefferens]|nr:hypothetical protein JL720_1214 [Aureococcus anophagefferens]